MSEGVSVFGIDNSTGVKVNFVCNYDAWELFAWVLLLNAFIPLAKQVEWVWVGDIIYQNDLICLAKKVESDFFEDVLAGNINDVQLYRAVASDIWLDFF